MELFHSARRESDQRDNEKLLHPDTSYDGEEKVHEFLGDALSKQEMTTSRLAELQTLKSCQNFSKLQTLLREMEREPNSCRPQDPSQPEAAFTRRHRAKWD